MLFEQAAPGIAEDLDPLTKIAKRDAFFRIVEEQTNEALKLGSNIAIVLVDIDRFYRVNARCGYAVGNQLLEKFAHLIQSVARQQDYVGRLGDNTFALLLNGVMNAGHAELAAHKILRLLNVPFVVQGEELTIDCTISICLCPQHARDARHLLSKAETLLYETKEEGKAIGLPQAESDELVPENWLIEQALSRALENNQLEVHYQPKVDIQSGRVSGAEALLRWKYPNKGYISPGIFIPIAEESGIIKPITSWLLNVSLRQAAEWTDRWGKQSVSINVPPDLILAPDFEDSVVNALHLWGGPNHSLTLEIIERSFVHQTEKTSRIISSLRDHGVSISIDDFGTGYSSLSYFEKLPIDELKIDQSFIRNLFRSKPNRNIVRFISSLAKSFNLRVVAEGVEEPATVEYLKTIGCELVQGFVFAKPMPQEEYKKWLENFEMP